MPTPNGHPGHHVKRVVLPGGKTIEVVYFADGQSEQPVGTELEQVVAAETVDVERELHECPECDSKLVYPTDWDEAGPHHWNVALRCPNCEWSDSGVFSQAIVDKFDEELDRGTEALIEHLQDLRRANMAEEIDRFVAALAVDAIVPMDF